MKITKEDLENILIDIFKEKKKDDEKQEAFDKLCVNN